MQRTGEAAARIPVCQLRRRERPAPYQTRLALLNGGLMILKDCVLESLPSQIVGQGDLPVSSGLSPVGLSLFFSTEFTEGEPNKAQQDNNNKTNFTLR